MHIEVNTTHIGDYNIVILKGHKNQYYSQCYF